MLNYSLESRLEIHPKEIIHGDIFMANHLVIYYRAKLEAIFCLRTVDWFNFGSCKL